MLLDFIHVVNLDRSVDRLNNFTTMMSNYNLTFTRFSAIDGKLINSQDLDNNTSLLCRTLLCNHGIVGCAMSHIDIWKKLVNDDRTDYYIVMEDDAIIDDQFIPIINEIDNIKHLIDFDILSLYCIREFNCKQHGKKYKLSNDLFIGKTLFPLSTTTYIVSKKGAHKLLKLFDTINYHIDVEIAIKSIFNGINYYSLSKNIIDHNWEENSTVGTHNHKSIFLSLLDKFGFSEPYWLLNSPTFTINMKHTVNLYVILLLVLLIVNFFIFNNFILYLIVFIELILFFCLTFIY